MKPQELEKWANIRTHGMLRYILINGVLSYGLIMFVVMTFIVHQQNPQVKNIAISAIIWFIAGALYGTAMWYIQERRFRKATSTQDDINTTQRSD